MHLLVTGGAGFIGSNFVRFVMRHRPTWSITNLDSLSYSGNLENLHGIDKDARYRFVKGDVCDAALVQSLVERVDAVVHMAAESHVDRSILDSRPFVVSNTLGTQTVLDACRRAKVGDAPWPGRLLYVSTDEVYGSLPLEKPELRFHETSPLEPNSPYAASKAAGDLLVRAYCRTFKLNAVMTRCSNNFGPYQFPEKVIPLFVTNLLEGQKVPLYGDGLNVRDWVHVDDHCEALLAVLERGKAGEVYNIGGENERSNLELTHTILKLMGKGDEMIRYVPDRPGHDRRYAVDGSKIARELGWTPSRSAWPDALAATIDWYRQHAEWWKHVKSGEYRAYYERQYGASGRQ
jgi:dTDP-glucose 4,6-dehydratase